MSFKLPYNNECYCREADLACRHLQNRIYCSLSVIPKRFGTAKCERIKLITYYAHPRYKDGSFNIRSKRFMRREQQKAGGEK